MGEQRLTVSNWSLKMAKIYKIDLFCYTIWSFSMSNSDIIRECDTSYIPFKITFHSSAIQDYVHHFSMKNIYTCYTIWSFSMSNSDIIRECDTSYIPFKITFHSSAIQDYVHHFSMKNIYTCA